MGLAAYATSGLGRESLDYVVDLALLLLATNFANLLDLRPGRAEKALLLVGAGLCIGYWTLAPVELLGLFIGFWVGLLPGIGGSTTLALMLPFVFGLEPLHAFVFLLAMHAVCATTGETSPVLVVA